jgi:hypothetical protein
MIYTKEYIISYMDSWQGFVCLFCFESHEQFFSYLATVTITGDRTANLDLCLALTAFSSKVLLCGTPTATSVFKVISERPVILPYECRALGEEAITTYFKRLRFDPMGSYSLSKFIFSRAAIAIVTNFYSRPLFRDLQWRRGLLGD